MHIRAYRDADAEGWLRCRVVAFLDCSYYNDVKTQRERYPHPSVCLVAEEAGRIVGLVDVELDSDDLSRTDEGRGAVLWHLAVLPEYRRQGVATALWERALGQLVQEGVRVCELWTQEDAAANRFYQSVGFRCEETSTWLRCYARGKQCRRFSMHRRSAGSTARRSWYSTHRWSGERSSSRSAAGLTRCACTAASSEK